MCFSFLSPITRHYLDGIHGPWPTKLEEMLDFYKPLWIMLCDFLEDKHWHFCRLITCILVSVCGYIPSRVGQHSVCVYSLEICIFMFLFILIYFLLLYCMLSYFAIRIQESRMWFWHDFAVVNKCPVSGPNMSAGKEEHLWDTSRHPDGKSSTSDFLFFFWPSLMSPTTWNVTFFLYLCLAICRTLLPNDT